MKKAGPVSSGSPETNKFGTGQRWTPVRPILIRPSMGIRPMTSSTIRENAIMDAQFAHKPVTNILWGGACAGTAGLLVGPLLSIAVVESNGGTKYNYYLDRYYTDFTGADRNVYIQAYRTEQKRLRRVYVYGTEVAIMGSVLFLIMIFS